jgi:hypothetical protein
VELIDVTFEPGRALLVVGVEGHRHGARPVQPDPRHELDPAGVADAGEAADHHHAVDPIEALAEGQVRRQVAGLAPQRRAVVAVVDDLRDHLGVAQRAQPVARVGQGLGHRHDDRGVGRRVAGRAQGLALGQRWSTTREHGGHDREAERRGPGHRPAHVTPPGVGAAVGAAALAFNAS